MQTVSKTVHETGASTDSTRDCGFIAPQSVANAAIPCRISNHGTRVYIVRDSSRVTRITALLLLLVGISTAAWTQDLQFAVRLDTRVGFAGAFKPGTWTPVSLTVQNLGPDVRGTLALELPRGDRFGPNRTDLSYQRPLDLVSGATKEFSFVLPLETAAYPVRVTIVHQNRLVVERTVELAGSSAPGALVVVLSRRPSLDFLLPVFNVPDERRLDLVYPLAEHLPDRWHGYDAVDLLVIHDARLEALTATQLTAIRNWVAAGGRMVVSTGAHFGPADAMALAPIMDLMPASLSVARAADLGFSSMGLPVVADEAEGQVVVTRFEGRWKTGIHRLGRGEIVVLPFDYAQFVRVAPVTSLGLWSVLLDAGTANALHSRAESLTPSGKAGAVPTSSTRRVFEDDLLANQMDLPLYDFPGRLEVSMIVAGYVGVVALLVLTMIRRRNRTAVLLGPPLMLVVAGIAALAGFLGLNVRQQPAEALAFSLQIAELGPGDAYAVVAADVALFSRGRTDYTVGFSDDPVVVPLRHRSQTVSAAGLLTEVRLPVERWGHENTLAVSVVSMEITARVQRGVGYVNIEVHNDTSVEVDGLTVLADGFPRALGALPPGGIAEHVVMGTGVGNWDETDWLRYVPPGELAGHRARLLRDLARRQRFRNDQNGPDEIVVVGWTDEQFIPTTVDPGFDRFIRLNAIVMRITPAGVSANASPVSGDRGEAP